MGSQAVPDNTAGSKATVGPCDVHTLSMALRGLVHIDIDTDFSISFFTYDLHECRKGVYISIYIFIYLSMNLYLSYNVAVGAVAQDLGSIWMLSHAGAIAEANIVSIQS
jgi:hypothetical protein